MKRKSVQKISQKFLKSFKMIPFFVISPKRSEDEYVKIKSVEQVLWPNVPILLYVVFVSVVVILWKICIIHLPFFLITLKATPTNWQNLTLAIHSALNMEEIVHKLMNPYFLWNSLNSLWKIVSSTFPKLKNCNF